MPPEAHRPLAAVLVGGRSSRFGVDKATAQVPDGLLGQRVVDACGAAGCEVLLVGARDDHRSLISGATSVPDLWPGDGPLGGLLTALAAADQAGATAVVCLACDLPHLSHPAVTGLLDAARNSVRPDGPVTLVTVDGRAAYPNGVWPTAARARLHAAFEAGERSLRGASVDLRVERWEGGDAFRDVDTPAALAAALRVKR